MLPFIDKQIEKIFTRNLHKKREKIVKKTLQDFIARNNPDEATITELKKQLELDAEAIMLFLDKSILHAGMVRARYVFFVTAIVGVAITAALAAYPLTTSIAVFFVPVMLAAVSWGVTIAILPNNYLHAVQGMMNSSVHRFEDSLRERTALEQDEANIARLTLQVRELQSKYDALYAKMMEPETGPAANPQAGNPRLQQLSFLTAYARRAAARHPHNQEPEDEVPLRVKHELRSLL